MIKLETIPSINGELEKIEGKLQEITETKFNLLYRISNRLLKAGGKRLRPLLVLLTGKLNNELDTDVSNNLISGGASIELLHMSTLIHDDVIDNSIHRRGENTVNRDWGNKVAVLSGDLLYTQALRLLNELGDNDLLDYMLDIVGLICEGEVKQAVTNHDLDQTMEDYIDKITKKTALLIAASCKLGGIVCELSDKRVDAIENYGKKLGIAFQIINDLNDVVAEKCDLGKEPGDDLRQGTLTLPVIYGLQESAEKEFLEEVIVKHENSDEEIERALKVLRSSGAIEYSIKVSQDYINQALDSLRFFSDSPAKSTLQLIAHTVINSYKGIKTLETGVTI
ncbi:MULTISPECIES: polyprenyl synthetase family protein [unclassified Candidatus Frackibacter]|uniref:polyprenyl synthetase family protein n=1 Tax=unclassified Candidatus Frackibacter TaxID=2648818 RepID=UPI00088164F2|nr:MULTISPECIES: polyprenyl synthetase family protein [unclassified Candidatus Frackibacter]SDC41408.1 heptaprenyl diphosphate synthase [Candidatus Frackibacter sp. WG11]SEM59554.1 heptaprenyl diphosphate synthase [Candidatus Frackibacter sp. WG12]SFL62514.1 heptaprenyl diphosphate synthase [Candidatus Frackibacter sp. WG13]